MARDDELFWETASIDYPIVDADAHVNEPPELWQDRVPQRFRKRAPRVERTDEGDAWVFDDGKMRMHVGLTAMAGRSFLDYANKNVTYAEMRPGKLGHAGAPARSRRRRHLGSGAVPEHHAHRREDLRRRTRAAARLRARLQRVAARHVRRLGRAADPPGDHAAPAASSARSRSSSGRSRTITAARSSRRSPTAR